MELSKSNTLASRSSHVFVSQASIIWPGSPIFSDFKLNFTGSLVSQPLVDGNEDTGYKGTQAFYSKSFYMPWIIVFSYRTDHVLQSVYFRTQFSDELHIGILKLETETNNINSQNRCIRIQKFNMKPGWVFRLGCDSNFCALKWLGDSPWRYQVNHHR